LLTACLAVASVPSGAVPTASTFGPKQYVRTAGPPTTFTETFPRCAGGNCQLVVVNGNPDGSNRISSATVSLNGKQILGPSDFNQNVSRIVKPVALTDTDQLKVVLKSAPGSFLTISVACDSFTAIAIGDTPVVSSIWDNGTVSLAIPLQNQGDAPANNVFITNMTAGAGTYAGPTPFSYAIGTLDRDDIDQLSAQFTSLNGLLPFNLTVTGTYGFGASVCSFQAQASVSPPPIGNGGMPKSATTAPTFTADTAYYPPAPMFHPPDDEPNDETGYTPPLGRPRNLFTTPPGLTPLNRILAFNPSDQPPPSGNPNDVVFFRNANGGSYNGLPPDPSAAGATPGGFAMISANTAVSYSTDFGKTFTTVNLTKATGFSEPSNPGRPDFFPEVDGGLCCDQVVQYVPSKNLMVWLLQYWSPSIVVGGLNQKGQNRLRIAFATPEAAAANFLHAWTWFDVSPTTLGDTTATDWMDYPDLAYSNDWLYISVDHGLWNAGLNTAGNVIGQQVYNARRWLVRASLNDMAGPASSINLVYYEGVKNGLVKAHFAQSSPDTMYFAAQPDTSTLSVFADPDSSPNIPTPKDLSVTSYCKAVGTNPCDFTVNAPDSLNWNVAPHGVLGATYVAPGALCPPGGCMGPTRFVYFAFDGGRDTGNGRAFPYIRIEKIDADAINLVSELDIWNSAFAFATPGLNWRPNSGKDEVAISLATGGGGSYADNAVGFLGDFVVYVTTSSNATQSNATPTVRYGDYFHVRNAFGPVVPDAGQGVGYSTLAYAVTQAVTGNTCAVSGCNVGLQFVLFGRNSDLFPVPSSPIK
jgi:hypothetical protein